MKSIHDYKKEENKLSGMEYKLELINNPSAF
ncbi:hypothetical protein MEZE111188_20920 [Mesobacillus zeae]